MLAMTNFIIPESEDPLEEHTMGRGAWWAIVYRMQRDSSEATEHERMHDWFIGSRLESNLHKVKVSGEVASADMGGAQEFQETLQEIINEGMYHSDEDLMELEAWRKDEERPQEELTEEPKRFMKKW